MVSLKNIVISLCSDLDALQSVIGSFFSQSVSVFVVDNKEKRKERDGNHSEQDSQLPAFCFRECKLYLRMLIHNFP